MYFGTTGWSRLDFNLCFFFLLRTIIQREGGIILAERDARVLRYTYLYVCIYNYVVVPQLDALLPSADDTHLLISSSTGPLLHFFWSLLFSNPLHSRRTRRICTPQSPVLILLFLLLLLVRLPIPTYQPTLRQFLYTWAARSPTVNLILLFHLHPPHSLFLFSFSLHLSDRSEMDEPAVAVFLYSFRTNGRLLLSKLILSL